MADQPNPAAATTTRIRDVASLHFTVRKRLLGIVVSILSAAALVGILAIDVLQPAREGSIGPAQRFAILMVLTSLAIGLSLLPLGDQEA
jgi:hypothetical protein